MNMTLNWSLYQRREEAAQLGTVLIGIFILVVTQTLALQHEGQVEEKPISLTIMAAALAPEKITPHVVQSAQPAQAEKIVEQVSPVAVIPLPVQAQVSAPVPPRANVEQVSAKPQPQRYSNSGAEGAFAQDVRSRIERRKVYPDTARDLGMEGEVEVLYELDRAGNLIHAEVVASSGYKLLDQAALKAVKSASYKSFPEDAWVGSGSKEFRTKLVFSINQ